MKITQMVNSPKVRGRASLPVLSGRIGKMIFGLSILLLLALAFAADRATVLFSDSEKWVAHTREVQTTLARLRTRLYQAQACRLDYVLTGNPVALDSLGRAREGLAGALALAHALITDNRCSRSACVTWNPFSPSGLRH
jgi:CHASE3 domain sensor protein